MYTEAASSSNQELANAFHGPIRILLQGSDPGLALLLLTQATKTQPENPVPWRRGGELFMELGLYPQAIPWLEQASKLALDREATMGLLEEAKMFAKHT
jgi:hypothetical protein